MKWPWKKTTATETPAPAPAPVVRNSLFSTDLPIPEKKNSLKARMRLREVLAVSFQRGVESFKPVDDSGKEIEIGHAMDEAYPDLTQAKLINNSRSFLPTQQLEWYAMQGFIGWQICAILAQNWLIDKACTVPAQDAIRNGWEIATTEGVKVDQEVLDAVRKGDRKFQIKRQAREFVKNGRIFGIRIAMFLVDGIDYAAPFNIDGVKAGSYKGITQIDPYWIAPELDRSAAADPAAKDFYEPTWWRINGQRVHRTHLVIMRNGDQVPDILKPSYMYGGISIPQKIFERVFAAEMTANEAPKLAMSKRLTTLKLDLTAAAANPAKLNERMEWFAQLQNNFGVKVIGEADEVDQFDTSLQGLDETIMTQFQLVAAAANMPATKLLGTSPKGFNATGLYEEASYHEELESIQEHDISPLIERHHLLYIKSYVAPAFKIDPFATEVSWKPVDSPTAKEQAEINASKAATDKILSDAGALDGFDIRKRISADPDSGYNGIPEMVPDGPGDREAEAEAKKAEADAANNPPDNKKEAA